MKQFYIILTALLVTIASNSQVSFSGNGGDGFFGALGFGILDIDFQESSTTDTFFRFSPGDELTDKIVIYIDSDNSRNFTSTIDFTDFGGPLPAYDELRAAISGFNSNEAERAILDFPPGFEADYAIAFDTGFAGLWQLNSFGAHTFIADLFLTEDFGEYEFELVNSDIGDPATFKFVATYISGSAFRSDESIGSLSVFNPNPDGNPGWAPGSAALETYFVHDGFESLQGGRGSTTSLASVWTFDLSWTNGNPPFDTDFITINHDITVNTDATVGVFDINASNTVTIDAGKSLRISGNATQNGNFINDGALIMNSTSTQFASLVVDGTVSGSGTTTYNRFTAQVGPTGTNDLISSPIDGQQFGAFATANSGDLAESGTLRAFAPFNPGTDAYTNYDTTINATTEIASGVGYRAGTQATGGETLAFSGTPNNGTIPTISLVNSTSIWNLMGNPYPSYIHLGDFLSENVATTNINDSFYGIYGYDGDASNGWTLWDLNVSQDFLIAPGQGFFVAAPSGGGSGIDFTASMQRIGTSDDFILGRNANPNFAHAIINLNTSSNSYETNVYFRDVNTRGLDPGFDTGAFNQTENGIFSQLVEENTGVNLVNQSLPFSDLTDITVPLVVNLDPSTQITFSLNGGSDLPNGIDIFLEDNVENTSTLLNSGNYTITPSTVLSGSGRFFLRFTSNALSNPDNQLTQLSIYNDYTNKTIVLSGQLKESTAVLIYDIQGREVLSELVGSNKSSHTIRVGQFQPGIYLVQLSHNGEKRAQKVIIN